MLDQQLTPDYTQEPTEEYLRRSTIQQAREEAVDEFMESYRQLHPEATEKFVKALLDKLTVEMCRKVVSEFSDMEYV